MSKRSFFLGAGASCADGFPDTRELICGIAHYVHQEKAKLHRSAGSKGSRRLLALESFLRAAFDIKSAQLKKGSAYWKWLPERSGDKPDFPSKIPSITELLSSIDSLIESEEGLAFRRVYPARLGPRELRQVRHEFSYALSEALADLHKRLTKNGREGTTEAFVSKLKPSDTIITSNWDVLIDQARDRFFGTRSGDYGSMEQIVKQGKRDPRDSRPLILKLHGSLNWLRCSRCQHLYVNPKHVISDLAFKKAAQSSDYGQCWCGFGLSSLLITPSFYKDYRNPHIANIWARALKDLSRCPEWIFIGYSLPQDDIHIRTLLIKAKRIRKELGRKQPKLSIVNKDEKVKKRFEDLIGEVSGFCRDFREYVKNGLVCKK